MAGGLSGDGAPPAPRAANESPAVATRPRATKQRCNPCARAFLLLAMDLLTLLQEARSRDHMEPHCLSSSRRKRGAGLALDLREQPDRRGVDQRIDLCEVVVVIGIRNIA